MRAIVACRTPKLGGHLACCADCGAEHLLFHSCCNRACPRCGGAASERWVAAQRNLLLSVPYFHVVFTLPKELRRVVRSNQRILLAALCRAAYDALAALCRDPKFLGARIGAVAVIHTWSRTLVWHPHVHMLVPGGGIDDNGATWRTVRKAGRKDFLVPGRALGSGFRARFMALPQDLRQPHPCLIAIDRLRARFAFRRAILPFIQMVPNIEPARPIRFFRISVGPERRLHRLSPGPSPLRHGRRRSPRLRFVGAVIRQGLKQILRRLNQQGGLIF